MPISIDADANNADWPKKRSWAFWTPDGRPVSTLAELRQLLPGRSDAEFRTWLKLPVARDARAAAP
jgi:hypothetical protein